jgi:Protein of unknown function (DUF1186)
MFFLTSFFFCLWLAINTNGRNIFPYTENYDIISFQMPGLSIQGGFFMEIALTSSYSPPVDQLLTYGETSTLLPPDRWPDYRALGLGPAHIPDLIRMLSDEKLHDVDSVEGWAPMHAYRAIAQLDVAAAFEPLLSVIGRFRESNDFAMEEIPYVLAMIGPSVLPRIAEYLADSSQDEWAHVCVIEGVGKIGLQWPEARAECVVILMAKLAFFDENDYHVNTFLVDALTDLHAVEAAPLIEQAFAANGIEEFIIGDWDDIQVKLGLRSAEEVEAERARERKLRRERRDWDIPWPEDEEEETSLSTELEKPSPEQEKPSPQTPFKASHKNDATRKKKTKNKMAKQSRKKNRKR